MNDITLRSYITAGQIENNFQEFLEGVRKMVEPYVGMMFNEEQTIEAKNTVAELNKYRKQIDGERLSVKKEWMKPYEEFEAKVKQALVIVDKAIEPIKAQVTEAEERRIEERKQEVEAIIEKVIKTRPSFEFIMSCPWFYDTKWQNKSVKLSAVESQVEERANQIDSDLSVISNDEYSVDIMAEYRKHGSLTQSLIVKDSIIRKKKEAEEYQERIKAQKLASVQQEPVKEPEVKQEEPEVWRENELITVTFKATATQEGLAGLKNYCRINNIILQRAD